MQSSPSTSHQQKKTNSVIAKLFTAESKTITGAALLISLATLLSRVLGIVRDRVFAHYFGAGPILDAYYAAFKIPDLIYNLLIVGALTAGFIPTFTRLLEKENKSSAWKLANNVLTILAVTITVVSIIGALVAPNFTHLLFPGFSEPINQLTSTMTRIMFISPVLLGISMVMGGILQSLRQFFLYSLAPVFYNLGIILGAVLLVPRIGPVGLAWGVVFGACAHAVIQAIGAYKNGFRWRWHFNLKDANTRLIGKLMIPRTMGLGLTQVTTIALTVLASLLPAGSVAVYSFANNLQAVPTGIIAIPFALAVFPILSSLSSETNRDMFIKQLLETGRKIIFLLVPCVVIILLLRAQIVRVILGSGAFDWSDTISTANTLAFFALGLIGHGLIPLFARAFYALSNTKTPFFIGIFSELISLISAYTLMKTLGVAGLALGVSLGVTVQMVLLGLFLRIKLGNFHAQETAVFITKIGVSALVMGTIIQVAKQPLGLLLNLQYFWGILLHGLLAGGAGLLAYVLLLRLLKVKEAREFVESIRKRLLTFTPVKEGIDEAETLS